MTLMFPVGIIQKALLGFYQPRALCSFSLDILPSLQQDSSFFTPICCVENSAFVFPWWRSRELSCCALSHERRNGLKSPVIAGGSRQRRKRADGRMFARVLRIMYCIMSVLSARLRESVTGADDICVWLQANFVLVQQDGDNNQTLVKGRKSTRAKQSERK